MVSDSIGFYAKKTVLSNIDENRFYFVHKEIAIHFILFKSKKVVDPPFNQLKRLPAFPLKKKMGLIVKYARKIIP